MKFGFGFISGVVAVIVSAVIAIGGFIAGFYIATEITTPRKKSEYIK